MIGELHVSLLFFAVLKFLPEYGWMELSPQQTLIESIGQRCCFSQNTAIAEKDLAGPNWDAKAPLKSQSASSCSSSTPSTSCSSESSLIKIPRMIPYCTYVTCDLFLLEDDIPHTQTTVQPDKETAC